MADSVFAVLGLVFCALVWAGMALGPARTARLRQRLQQAWARQGRRAGGATARPPTEADTRQARDAAAAAIERARRASQVAREGNVYRPDRFQKGGENRQPGPGKDTLH